MVLIRNLFFYTGLALAITICFPVTQNNHDNFYKEDNADQQVTENFESAVKGSYATADVTLPTGSWNFKNALIGTSPADQKQGSRSVRIRTGSISMNFDISNISQVQISHSRYGKDRESRWRLMVSLDGGLNYSQVGKMILETNTRLVTDTFNLKPFYKMRFRIQHTGSTPTARINIDDFTFVKVRRAKAAVPVDSSQVIGQSAGQSFSGKTRGIIYDEDAQPESGDDSNMLFGNPSNATAIAPENYYLDLKYYTESYSKSRAIPNWVSWHLDASSTTNAADRLDNFAGFSGLPPDYFIAQSNSYVGSGFDRGHNCPSADRSSSKAANSATFLMTNMVPQAPRNNQRTWANFESYLRKQVDDGNEVYVIMGNYGTGGIGTKGAANTICNGNIAVPANLWKVAIILPAGNADLTRTNASTNVIAISAANINSIDPDWKKYIVTVDEIEEATGYDLLSALPERVQELLERKKGSIL
jgi:endonuclease G